MSHYAPWVVRHIHTALDPRFKDYLHAMRELLRKEHEQGRIAELHEPQPVHDPGQLIDALGRVDSGDLVIVDFHGWSNGVELGLDLTGVGPHITLAQIPPNSCRAAALVFSSCWGGHDAFNAQLAPALAYSTAVAGHFEEVDFEDHRAVRIVEWLIADADGGDEDQAARLLGEVVRSPGFDGWTAGLLRPANRQGVVLAPEERSTALPMAVAVEDTTPREDARR